MTQRLSTIKRDLFYRVTVAAEMHGQESEPRHEVGDLQDALRTCFRIMSTAQCRKVVGDEAMEDILRWSEGEDGDEDDDSSQ